MIQPKSLQQRLFLFLLLPVAFLLVAMGFTSFIFARNTLIEEWSEKSLLVLRQTAHQVDMRLKRVKDRLLIFNKTDADQFPRGLLHLTTSELKSMDGVVRVKLNWVDGRTGDTQHQRLHRNTHSMSDESIDDRRLRRFHRSRVKAISLPRYDDILEKETVSLISEFKDQLDQIIGNLEVVIRFDYLTEAITSTHRWRANMKGFLIDDTGTILTSTTPVKKLRMGEAGDALELSILSAAKDKPFGNVFGKGRPPEIISGFYRLHEAPWTLVVIAPGKEILAPIIRFRNFYLATILLFIISILFLIRFVTGKTVTSIKNISKSAREISSGNYTQPLEVKTQDEVGELTRSFNTMVVQLEERNRLKQALHLAEEMQRNLLPQKALQFDNIEIAGKSIYCDETGGDYYDFFKQPSLKNGAMGIAVGDVVGHGISAALLMTTARALIRSRLSQSGALAEQISDVNRLLCNDTEISGSFMTLFIMTIEGRNKEIRWVRAGHDPAFLYEMDKDDFIELKGQGMALGYNADYRFRDNRHEFRAGSHLLMIGTDGLWETVNAQGEPYGKSRIRELLRQYASEKASDIVNVILEDVVRFRGNAVQEDDITVVVTK